MKTSFQKFYTERDGATQSQLRIFSFLKMTTLQLSKTKNEEINIKHVVWTNIYTHLNELCY